MAVNQNGERNLFDIFNTWRGTGESPGAVLAALGDRMLQAQIDIIGASDCAGWFTGGSEAIAAKIIQGEQYRSRMQGVVTQLMGGTPTVAIEQEAIWVAEAKPQTVNEGKEKPGIRFWRFSLSNVVYLADAAWPINPNQTVPVVENTVYHQLTRWEQMQREMAYNELVYGNPHGRSGPAHADMGGPM